MAAPPPVTWTNFPNFIFPTSPTLSLPDTPIATPYTAPYVGIGPDEHHAITQVFSDPTVVPRLLTYLRELLQTENNRTRLDSQPFSVILSAQIEATCDIIESMALNANGGEETVKVLWISIFNCAVLIAKAILQFFDPNSRPRIWQRNAVLWAHQQGNFTLLTGDDPKGCAELKGWVPGRFSAPLLETITTLNPWGLNQDANAILTKLSLHMMGEEVSRAIVFSGGLFGVYEIYMRPGSSHVLLQSAALQPYTEQRLPTVFQSLSESANSDHEREFGQSSLLAVLVAMLINNHGNLKQHPHARLVTVKGVDPALLPAPSTPFPHLTPIQMVGKPHMHTRHERHQKMASQQPQITLSYQLPPGSSPQQYMLHTPLNTVPVIAHTLIAKGGTSTVYRGTYDHKPVIVKIIEDRDAISREASIYESALTELMGTVVPTYYGTYDVVVGDSLICSVMILEDVGDSLPGWYDFRESSAADRMAIRSHLRALHSAGVFHGDLVPNNVTTSAQGLRLIDFSHSRAHNCEGDNCPELQAFDKANDICD